MICKYRLPKYKSCAGMLLRSGTKACGLKTSTGSSYCATHKQQAIGLPFFKMIPDALAEIV